MKLLKLLSIIFMFLVIAIFLLHAQGKGKPQRMMLPEGTYQWVSGRTSTTIPFELIGNLIALPVEINNVKTNLVLDTGMPILGALISNNGKAPELKLTYSGETQMGSPGGVGSPAKVSANNKFKLGELEFSGQTCIVMAKSRNLSYYEFDGVIGNEIFTRFIVDVDYEKNLITLTEPSQFTPKNDVEKIDLVFEMGYPFVQCSVTLESGITIPIDLVLDLGASHTVALNPGSQKDIIVPSQNIKASVGRSVSTELFGYKGRITKFKFGTQTFNNVLATFNEGARPGFEKHGNIGSGILKRFNLTFDYGNKSLYLKPNKYFNDPFEFNMAGIQTSKSSDGIITIDRLIPNSAGNNAGLKAGDVIIEIDKKNVAEMKKGDLEKIFEKENRVVELTIKRGDTTKLISVKLRRVI